MTGNDTSTSGSERDEHPLEKLGQAAMEAADSGGSFHAECVCGWSITRDKRASNLPVESNERIARTVAHAHEYGPRFGDKADETHEVSFTGNGRSGGGA